MKRFWLIFALSAVVLVLAACGGGGGDEGPSDAAVEAGRELFNTGGESQIPCMTCHTLDGTDLVGPSLEGISERAGERVAGMSAEEYLHQSIVDPSAHIVEGYEDTMNKTYDDMLSDEAIDQLVAFLMTQ